jgi:hypothetical protein
MSKLITNSRLLLVRRNGGQAVFARQFFLLKFIKSVEDVCLLALRNN